jgi:hypothetical protein
MVWLWLGVLLLHLRWQLLLLPLLQLLLLVSSWQQLNAVRCQLCCKTNARWFHAELFRTSLEIMFSEYASSLSHRWPPKACKKQVAQDCTQAAKDHDKDNKGSK